MKTILFTIPANLFEHNEVNHDLAIHTTKGDSFMFYVSYIDASGGIGMDVARFHRWSDLEKWLRDNIINPKLQEYGALATPTKSYQ